MTRPTPSTTSPTRTGSAPTSGLRLDTDERFAAWVVASIEAGVPVTGSFHSTPVDSYE
jgi:hypothetical protein